MEHVGTLTAMAAGFPQRCHPDVRVVIVLRRCRLADNYAGSARIEREDQARSHRVLPSILPVRRPGRPRPPQDATRALRGPRPPPDSRPRCRRRSSSAARSSGDPQDRPWSTGSDARRGRSTIRSRVWVWAVTAASRRANPPVFGWLSEAHSSQTAPSCATGVVCRPHAQKGCVSLARSIISTT